MTSEEILLYIKCMTINSNVDDSVYSALSEQNIKDIDAYMQRPMTATTFSGPIKSSSKIITAELIYYWMCELGIPIELEKWHINRLFTLIRVASIERAPKKKMSRAASYRQYDAINEARRKALHSKG